MIEQQGHFLRIPAQTAVADLLAFPGLPPALARAEEPAAGGSLAAALQPAGNRLACALLALDSQLELSADKTLGYGDFLALGPAALGEAEWIALQFSTQPQLSFAADPAGLHLALARWPSGRARLAVGGFAAAPALAMDGREPSGLQEALENTLSAVPEHLPAALELLAAVAV
ncbi:MAG: hypothetical protein KIT46_01885 [Anaerolineales bacterium]|nr:hypothetical protein [Anaerolineales bacterium]MCW5854775.1 hypothetical protein [Anaerolineales bacterium]